jgi:hypothetical protein
MIEKCPICKGCGLVPGGFYTSLQGHIDQWTSGNSSEICRACNGCGIIHSGGLEPCNTSEETEKLYQYNDKEDSITVLKEIRQILKDILNHQERHV